MKVQVSETTPVQLDWLVAKCEGRENDGTWDENFSTNWLLSGPIIEREKISIQELEGIWSAFFRDKLFEDDNSECWQDGSTPLIAAMRCYVASKLGKTVEVPEELK